MMILGKPEDPKKVGRAVSNLQTDEDFDVLFLYLAKERKRLLDRVVVTQDERIVRQLQGALMVLGDLLNVCEGPHKA